MRNQRETADIILHHGRVLTVDAKDSIEEAVAIQGKHILAVGKNQDILALAGGAGSALGTGGMATKLHAAQIATEAGVSMVLANGADPTVLYDILAGAPVGTLFVGKEPQK